MKRVINTLLFLSLFTLCAKAQVMVDDFESNQFGWTETSQRGGIAIIQDGVMRLESKAGTHVLATCYAPFEYSKPFTMSVDVTVDKMPNWASMQALGSGLFGNGAKELYFNGVGLIFDYEDDGNYLLFSFCKDFSVLYRIINGMVVASKKEDLKLPKGKNVAFTVEAEYNLNEILFKINGVRALSYRRRVAKDEFLLGTSGIGFITGTGQKVSFDNLKVDQ